MAVAPTVLSHSCRGAAGTPCPVDTLTQHSWCCHKAAAVLQGLAIMGLWLSGGHMAMAPMMPPCTNGQCHGDALFLGHGFPEDMQYPWGHHTSRHITSGQ